MNENLIALIAALRSGQYNQITGRLRSGDCFCVQGVGCHLADPTKWERLNDSWFYESASGCTNNWVPAHYGLSSGLWDKLMILNDSHRFTFPEIADYIEEVFANE